MRRPRSRPKVQRRAMRIKRQPDDLTCGPTCLHSLYQFYGDDVSLDAVIREVEMQPEGGGTFAANLGYHALQRGYQATIHSLNLLVFDPTWARLDQTDIIRKLQQQREHKTSAKLRLASDAYLRFLAAGGQIQLDGIDADRIEGYLRGGVPILAGLSATYLYWNARELPKEGGTDDVRGTPSGHFVVVSDLDRRRQKAVILDPYQPNPLSEIATYSVPLDRLLGAILLGVVTYDANLLVIKPPMRPKRRRKASL